MRPIWESASRPLFVRSVWREAIGRRHFILDYEPRQRQRWKRQKTKLKASQINSSYQQTQSCEFYEQSTEDSVDYLDEYLLLDATKLTLKQQQSLPQMGNGRAGPCNAATSTGSGSREHRNSSRQAKRRAWLLSRGRTYHLDHHLATTDNPSRRSSLQDASTLVSTANNPEERLAERVLHWLDLAGRTDIVKAAEAPSTPPSNGVSSSARSGQRLQRSNHRSLSLRRVATAAASHHQRSVAARKPSAKPAPVQQQTQQQVTNSATASASNAKPITIIFNKEGVPVRLNRPARNIDLCAMSSSASTTRRLAGQLASARLYSGTTTSPQPEETRTPPLSSRGMASASSDSRKQLHIFMPSLPKKGLLGVGGSTSGSGIGGSGEDALSTSFSELCQL